MPGPAKGALCTACNHAQSRQLNELVNDKQRTASMAEIGRRFGLHKDVVLRHVNGRHPGIVAPDGTPSEEGELTGSELDRLRATTKILEVDFRKRPDPNTSRELRLTYQRIAELEGRDVPRVATVADVEGLPELFAAWYEALEPFPEARRAMADATERLAPQLMRAHEEAISTESRHLSGEAPE